MSNFLDDKEFFEDAVTKSTFVKCDDDEILFTITKGQYLQLCSDCRAQLDNLPIPPSPFENAV